MNKIAVVVVYFGKFPNYFGLWLKSCEKNPTIDFLVMTDQQLENRPKNVIVKPMTIECMREKASSVLGFAVKLDRPYKCCDFRPLYGLMFGEELKNYDYWGHADIDLIFGNLQYFFDKYRLYDYDKFGALGHLALYKNTDKVNNAFKLQGGDVDYRQVFTTEDNFIFDEVEGITKIMRINGFKVFTKRIFVDIATRYKRYRMIDSYSLDESAKNFPAQTFYWEDGHIYHAYYEKGQFSKEEYLYAHFQKRPNFHVLFNCKNENAFYITNTGFYIKKGNPTRKQVLRLNPFYGAIYERLEFICREYYQKVKNRIK